ncbi:MAG: LytTR family DNA-binding domain-containing protein [Bacteroidales bacterium]|nr:LytTR family DNA-binding domain-containing protein [Lachnoclostridium sp.]MCM1384231.1 LytTR family DNA-binding domain-containing protein [Lachnoclostridium sp.]MCM1464731.1 LytTR family DNA-binding domain-containing protein [Bacteroidales bacterium]
MHIAVCDDCREDALFLKALLKGHEVSIYFDADSLLTDIEGKRIQYDLYLLDIFIEESISGIELAERLRKIQEEAVLCFVSTSDDFYREAYDLYAVQYLIKPVQKENLDKLLAKVQKISDRDSEKALIYSWWGKTGMIPYRKIRYISSRGHTLSIYCTDGKIQESTGKLNDLELQVCGDDFMRCHQSFIVNMYQVEELRGTDLMIAGELIPVSRRYYPEIKKRYREILFEEVDE